MRIVSEDHLEALNELAYGATAIEIASPYFDQVAVREILRVAPEASIRFTFRWPAQDDSPGAIDPGALKMLMAADHEVRFAHPDTRLHAKVYVADEKRALVTSANFTSPGLGLRGSRTNAELGLVTSDAAIVTEVVAWFERLPTSPLTKQALQELETWVRNVPPPVSPPKAPRLKLSDQAVVQAALQRAEANGVILAHEHLPTGAGRNAFVVRVPGVNGWLTLRAKVSGAEFIRGKSMFHFEMYRTDVEKEGVDGFIFVPTGENRSLLDAGQAPTLFVPFDRMVGGGSRRIGRSTLRRAERGGRRAALELESGVWTLRVPVIKGAIDLLGCVDDTAAFQQYYW